MWTNYHTHSFFSDGKGNPKDYVNEAVKKNMYALGFSCHSPVPFNSEWNMKKENLEKYINTISSLKDDYKDSIKLYTGLEVDYISEVQGPSGFSNIGLDYTIGAVHYLGKFPYGRYWNFDDNKEDFRQGLNEVFGGDIKKLVTYYFTQIIEMVKNDPPDIVAHLDIVNKFNQYEGKNNFWSEDEKWYKDIVIQTLEVIAGSHAIIEINTRGYMKKLAGFFYPNIWIIRECLKLNIPITLSSDAHTPPEVDSYLSESAILLKETGYNEIFILDEKGWHPVGFGENGIMVDS